jgi:hypothetical protein
MRNEIFRRYLRDLALAWFPLAAVAGCRGNEPITSWDSPRLLKVQREWESLRDNAKKMPEEEQVKRYGDKDEGLYDLLAAIIEKQVSQEEMRRLAASCGKLPVREKDRSDFVNAVLSSMLFVFVKSGDRDSLVTLLSTRCPVRAASNRDIEYFLLLYGDKLKDPITILGDAFSKCRSAEVRHQLADAVRRGFRGHEIRGKDDADFVKNAMQWYGKNKDHLTFNDMYGLYAQHTSEEGYERYPEENTEFPSGSKPEPLFLLSEAKKNPDTKSSEEAKKGTK